MNAHELRRVAEEKDWMRFGAALETAMAEPGHYGLAQPRDVVAQVARMRRQLVSSQKRALEAVRYLRASHPEVLAAGEARVGCIQVNLLARIEATRPDLASALAPKVFAGAVRAEELRAVLFGPECADGAGEPCVRNRLDEKRLRERDHGAADASAAAQHG